MRKGLVTMIVKPATMLLSTPCSASPIPSPATPMPATSGATWKPNLSSASTSAKSMTTMRRARTASVRMGGSTALRAIRRSAISPTQRAATRPTTRMIRAPRIWNP